MAGRYFTELKKIKPSIKVVLTSGYSLDGLAENGQDLPGDGFLQKPYRIRQLSAVIGQLLVKQTGTGKKPSVTRSLGLPKYRLSRRMGTTGNVSTAGGR
jgi:DNA-binding response OmpR family regulator